ncbi:MAG: hypothetical protein Ta2G_07090 [Termitinemataceae bacterium]|nr:MAG: hypothetical protein Ta2G_07090 [Termitinemataceae bacterium]
MIKEKGKYYQFLTSKNGDVVPAIVDANGVVRSLHSLFAPQKEAERIIAGDSGAEHNGYLVLLGFGGGYIAEAALAKNDIYHVLVIDYCKEGFEEIIAHKDFSSMLSNKKLHILLDPSKGEIETHILSTYNPTLHGGLRTIPLRTRCDADTEDFNASYDALKSALDKVKGDYSVQVHFGKRWFSNIIRNLYAAEKQLSFDIPMHNAAICAAGPSLDGQLEEIKKEQADNNFFVLATDTSLGTLLQANIKPDAIVSMDCQHISYYHFVGYTKEIKDIPLFLDIASPSLLSKLSNKVFFFLSAHPLCSYIEKHFRNLPRLDTSGANVTYASLSLAQKAGAKNIKVFGADFSYPQGCAYTRGAYFYPYFDRSACRLKPVEQSLAAFLYRSPSLKMIIRDIEKSGRIEKSWCYQTASLKMYQDAFEKKLSELHSEPRSASALFSSGSLKTSAKDFLQTYRKKISSLDNDINEGFSSNLELWNSLLPAASTIRHKQKISNIDETAEETKKFALRVIEKLLQKTDN